MIIGQHLDRLEERMMELENRLDDQPVKRVPSQTLGVTM